MHRKRIDTQAIDTILNKASGLKGISGISNDMRLLCASSQANNKRSRLAIDIFVYRIRKYIGAYAAIMGGVDALIFTAGIGENSAFIRKRVCQGILNSLKNKPKVLVIPTDEELMIARQTYKLVGS